VQSTIRVPAQPSFPLQKALDRLNLAIQPILPYTLPPSVAQLLVDRATQHLAAHYQTLSAKETVRTNQNLALQHFFDLKWIALMLVTRDSKPVLDEYTALIAAYKSHIDPFDFDVFYTHLNNNVKKSGQRMQFQIGCIVPSMDQVLGLVGGQLQATIAAHEKDPNVLPLSASAASVPWFPLLPLPADGLGSSQPSASDLQQAEAVSLGLLKLPFLYFDHYSFVVYMKFRRNFKAKMTFAQKYGIFFNVTLEHDVDFGVHFR
jgi:conserved oligomeric Golgi complex subunit 1